MFSWPFRAAFHSSARAPVRRSRRAGAGSAGWTWGAGADVNIGISVRKGNTELLNKINAYFSGKTESDFNALMEEAIKDQPIEE